MTKSIQVSTRRDRRRLGSGWAYAVMAALGTSQIACSASLGEDSEAERLGEQRSSVVIAPIDSRASLTEAVFDSDAVLKSIGYIWTGGGTCSGTLISSYHVLTTAHCFSVGLGSDTVPSNVRFLPKFRYDPADPSSATKASVYGSRITMGTGIGSDYIAGSDWAVITLNTATYTPGSNSPAGCSGAGCTYKAGFSALTGYTPMPITYPTLGLPSPITVTAVGYSGDWFASTNMGARHVDCSAYAEELPTYPGILKADCDSTGGASGGPLYRTIGGVKYLTALVGGDAGTFNREVSSAAFIYAPINTGGIASVKDSAGATWVFGTDRDWYLKVSARKQLSAGGIFNAWWDFRDGGASPPQLPDRITGTRLASADGSRMWLFMTSRDNGQVWSRWESSLGSWSAWTQFFPGSANTLNALDVAVTSNGEASASGAAVIQTYILKASTIATTRKTTTWDGAWSAWTNLSIPFVTMQPTLAAVVTGGFQVLSTAGRDAGGSDSIATTWTTAAGGNSWVAWLKESAPSSGVVVDVEYGHAPSGALDMYVIMAPGGLGSASRTLWRRTKVSAVPGSAWGSWSNFANSTTFSGLSGAYRIAVAPPESGDTAANPRVKVASNWGIAEWALVGGTWMWRAANGPRL